MFNSHPTLGWGKSQLTSFSFAGHCMKYPDLHRKVMFTKPKHHGLGFQGKHFCEEFNEMVGTYRKLIFDNFPIGNGWGQFTKIFVFDVTFLMHWTPTFPTP